MSGAEVEGRGGAGQPLEIIEVTKEYGDTTALTEFTLGVEAGEFVVLLGPSGCGKSTLLKLIAGLEDVTAGEIYIDGRLVNFVPPKARDVAMVFQNYALYPHMTVKKNLSFPLRMRRQNGAEIRDRVREVARLLELGELLERLPEQLSGGQRQRVALGRAMVRDPVAFLMDEPLSNLDALLRLQTRQELLKLHRRIGRTTVYVTHDQVEAMTMADRVVVMRSGVIQAVGTPQDVYTRPANTFVATFVGVRPMNLIHGRLEVSANGARFLAPSLEIGVPAAISAGETGRPVVLGIRAEGISVASERQDGQCVGIVELVEPMGADQYVTVKVSDDVSVVVSSGASLTLWPGERIQLYFRPEQVTLFDEQSGSRLEGFESSEPGAGCCT